MTRRRDTVRRQGNATRNLSCDSSLAEGVMVEFASPCVRMAIDKIAGVSLSRKAASTKAVDTKAINHSLPLASVLGIGDHELP
ncbi:hypothetical protein [Rubripirellula amarantea]|nr:hypothetical protein [Rubripirellula amarantea]